MKVQSDTYGEYETTKICELTFYPKSKDGMTDDERWEQVCEWDKWISKFHPRRFFGAFSIKTTRPDLPKHSSENLCQEHFPYELYLPLRENNKDWYKNNKDSEFGKYIRESKGSRILPISITPKQLERWIKSAKKIGAIEESA